MLLLTGPTASGKNTAGRLLAQRQARCAVVDFDLVRAMFVHPHRAPWQGDEGRAQQALGIRLTVQAALGFQQAGWKVIVLDVITDDVFPLYAELLAGVPFSVVQLLPSLAETRRRFEARGPVLTQAEFEQVYAGQLAFTHADLRLDTTHLTPEAIAERLLGFL